MRNYNVNITTKGFSDAFSAQPGWEAVFMTEDGNGYKTYPVVAWAKVEIPFGELTGSITTALILEGMVLRALNMDDITNFIGYNYPGLKVDWANLAYEKHKAFATGGDIKVNLKIDGKDTDFESETE
jgi:hypothetical protein